MESKTGVNNVDQEARNRIAAKGLEVLQRVPPSGNVAFYTQYDNVIMFHAAAGAEGIHQIGRALAPIHPDLIDYKQTHISAKFEEAMRALDNVGSMGMLSAESVAVAFNALIDVCYYAKSICVMLGLPYDTGFGIVHQSNIAKLMVPEVKFLEDGRVAKPEGWVSPTEVLKKLVLAAAEDAGTVDAPGAV